MVLPASHGQPLFPWYSRTPPDGGPAFDYGALTPCGGPFQVLRLARASLRPALGRGPRTRRTTPAPQRLPASCTARVWAAPRSLATTRGMLSAPRGTEMFQFPHLPPLCLCVQQRVTGHDPRRVTPFGHRRRIACLRPTVAFRSLPRPSSACVAEASTAYPSSREDIVDAQQNSDHIPRDLDQDAIHLSKCSPTSRWG